MSQATKAQSQPKSKRKRNYPSLWVDLPDDLAEKVEQRVADHTETKRGLTIKAFRLYFTVEEAKAKGN